MTIGRIQRYVNARATATTETTTAYAVNTHETPTMVVSNSPYRRGSASTTIDASANAKPTATVSSQAAAQPPLPRAFTSPPWAARRRGTR